MPSFLSRLFGRPAAAATPAPREPILHNGFRIYPEPLREASGFRISARIEKEVGGATRHHHLIRADILSSEEEAIATSVQKARQAIDQLGEGIFG